MDFAMRVVRSSESSTSTREPFLKFAGSDGLILKAAIPASFIAICYFIVLSSAGSSAGVESIIRVISVTFVPKFSVVFV